MAYVRGHWRNGKWVRPHYRRGRASGPLTVMGGVLLLGAGWFGIIKPTLDEQPQTYTDVAVVDGDTIRATNPDGHRERVRILGINAPEADACGGAEATAHLTQLLSGHATVKIVRDNSQPKVDKYGRTLGYLDLDGTDVGGQMITDGYAVELTVGNPHGRADDYAATQSTAQAAGAGVWATWPSW